MTLSTNPLTAGMQETLFPQPCTLVIFGGGGDLSKRKLLPAIYNLSLDGVLPTNFAVVGFAMNDQSDESYRNFAREGIEKFSRRPVDAARPRTGAPRRGGPQSAPSSASGSSETLRITSPERPSSGSVRPSTTISMPPALPILSARSARFGTL